jgi:hypothetical protein
LRYISAYISKRLLLAGQRPITMNVVAPAKSSFFLFATAVVAFATQRASGADAWQAATAGELAP